MTIVRQREVGLVLMLAILLAGCQNQLEAPTQDAWTRVVADQVTLSAVASSDPPRPEQSLVQSSKRPKPARLFSGPALPRSPRREPHRLTPSPPPRALPSSPPRRQRPDSKPPRAEASAVGVPSAAAPVPQKIVSAKLPTSDYPLAKPREAELEPKQGGERLGQPVFISLDGDELKPSDEEPAYPTYHPSVVIDGWVDGSFIYVSFELQPNGAFRASIVDGTGVPEFDAIALATVRRWTWQAKRVKGRPVASTELIRLKRSGYRGR